MHAQPDSGGRRPAAVAGTFYPAQPGRLRAMVRGMLEQGRLRLTQATGGQEGRGEGGSCGSGGPLAPTGGEQSVDPLIPLHPQRHSERSVRLWPKAIVVPHAGYIYSGPIAGSAYAAVAQGRGTIRRVVMMGPSHRVDFAGLAVPTAAAFETPLGAVAVDRAAVAALLELEFVVALDQAHQAEHSLEVHLPFLIEVLGKFAIVPVVFGQATAEEARQVFERLWGGPETLVVVSSDLSHYCDYAAARRLDLATARAITALDARGIAAEQACGRVAITGLLAAAAAHGLHAHVVDLRNSGDTAGSRQEVVGYGAFVFT